MKSSANAIKVILQINNRNGKIMPNNKVEGVIIEK